MQLRYRLARWWAHRRLDRGRCQWCGKTLPDTGPPVAGLRMCSEECANDWRAW